MHRYLTKFMQAVAVLAFTIAAEGADRWETLHAINLVENPTNQTRTGRFGELGPYQFRPATWKMHTDKPFRLALQREAADEIAVKHYEWIKRCFAQAGIDPSPFNIALAWNCGVDAVVNGRAPSASFQYAERVNNLVETFEAQRSMANEPAPEEKRPAEGTNGIFRFQELQDMPRFVIASS